MDTDTYAKLVAQLTLHEGRRTHLYQDTLGNWTIGVGFHIGAHGLPEEIIDELLRLSIKSAESACKRMFPDFENYSPNRRIALIDLVFNIGEGGFLKFRNTIRHIRANNWDEAARHLRASLWYRQVQKSRRDRVVLQIERG